MTIDHLQGYRLVFSHTSLSSVQSMQALILNYPFSVLCSVLRAGRVRIFSFSSLIVRKRPVSLVFFQK